jgi:lycopene beta-cyclase
MNTPAQLPVSEYDYVLLGGGAAGLSLAYHLAQEPRLAGQRVLLIEPEPKDQNDRTWSYWSATPGPFDHLAVGEWDKIAFRSPGFEQVLQLHDYRYRTIRGLDFYQFVQQALAARPAQFTLVRGTVAALTETATGVVVRTEAEEEYRATWRAS